MPSRATPPLAPAALPALAGLLLAFCGCSTLTSHPPASHHASAASLRKGLTFHASFDRTTDADFALGDPWLYHAPKLERIREAQPGLPTAGAARIDTGSGRHGGSLRFDRQADPVVFYRADKNLPWSPSNWSGSVSFWLLADLATLAPGYADPVNITPRAWDDAAFFVEFEKRTNDVPFRLGAYADKKVWNPLGKDWGKMTPAEKPLVTIPGPPFSGERWTHVVITWERFNTGAKDGAAVLYLDGAQVGSVRGFNQTFTWNPTETRIHLGIGYIGALDELAVFNRCLTMPEIQLLRTLPRGVRSIYSR
jgi:hypothetical protein